MRWKAPCGGVALWALLMATCLPSHAVGSADSQVTGPEPSICRLTWGVYQTDAPWDSRLAALHTLDRQVNRHSAIIHWYAQWGDPGSGVFVNNEPRLLRTVHTYRSVGATGATPLITWEPWGPDAKGNYSISYNAYPLKDIAAGKFDVYIDTWVAGLKRFRHPVLLDFAHEMDGNWYPWGYGVNNNRPADYIAAYRHVWHRFQEGGARDVRFVWNPDYWNATNVDQRRFYPGSPYVDRIGIDVFNAGARDGRHWASLAQLLTTYSTPRNVYARLAALNRKTAIMLVEWASNEPGPGDPTGVTKARWIDDAASVLPRKFPRIGAIVWFNESGGTNYFRIDASRASVLAAKRAFGGCGHGQERGGRSEQ
jgi:hypothetical protein